MGGKVSCIQAQAGFRQCVGALDYIFIVLGAFTYLLNCNKKLYVAFVDLNITFEALADQEMKAIIYLLRFLLVTYPELRNFTWKRKWYILVHLQKKKERKKKDFDDHAHFRIKKKRKDVFDCFVFLQFVMV